MTRGAAGISPVMLQQYLTGLSYPASRQDLVSTALRNKAPGRDRGHDRAFPKEQLMGPQEVQRPNGDIT